MEKTIRQLLDRLLAETDFLEYVQGSRDCGELRRTRFRQWKLAIQMKMEEGGGGAVQMSEIYPYKPVSVPNSLAR